MIKLSADTPLSEYISKASPSVLAKNKRYIYSTLSSFLLFLFLIDGKGALISMFLFVEMNTSS
jgi:hypothetical protein